MIRKVLLDDDILLDILLERDPFVEDSSKIWELIETKQVEGYVTLTTLNKIFDVGRDNGGFEIAWEAISEIRSVMKVCIIDDRILEIAHSYHLKDFEQSIQLACAKFFKLDYILTRKVEYIKSSLQNLGDSYKEFFSVVKPTSFLFIYFRSHLSYGFCNSLEFYKILFQYYRKRIEIVGNITNKTDILVNYSLKYLLDSISTQSIEIQNQQESENKIAVIKRDIATIVRYIIYAILAEKLTLDDNYINSCFTECNSLNISRQSLIIALQHTKELTIKLTTQPANQDIDFSDLNYKILVNEISRYFDQFIIKLTSY
ncbi:PIN domain-containing protein [Dolichospermum circinale CS-1225]|uniref:PIN domain-containing protein n=1 Tax=Dolichospermum circinale TaxID=109265 RepID=UPI0004165864|nr:PIN domain-containing protein [Dolichospermum circinale]MDB9523910.1 PIN domain-containing protein [Dolichospermum circinale CS-1225]